ncbi:MAG: hypothetical protein ACIALR_14625 [Blastopirellula sp. JB062]
MSTFHHSRSLPKWALAGAIMAIVMTQVGCSEEGESLTRLSGQVTIHNQPVPFGVIQFTPDASAGNQGAAGFAEIRDGRFDTDAGGRGVTGGAFTAMIDAYSMQNVNPDIKPYGDPLVTGYKRKVTVDQGPAAELNFEIDRNKR